MLEGTIFIQNVFEQCGKKIQMNCTKMLCWWHHIGLKVALHLSSKAISLKSRIHKTQHVFINLLLSILLPPEEWRVHFAGILVQKYNLYSAFINPDAFPGDIAQALHWWYHYPLPHIGVTHKVFLERLNTLQLCGHPH